jgi:ubiquitin C-terminal hydrolase
MFGLQNFKGSCWVNAALQAVFATPNMKVQYTVSPPEADNIVDICLESVWKNKGSAGLREFFDCIRTTYMPAGQNIGDSHELLVHLCDKLPWLDKALRFTMARQLVCKSCNDQSLVEDTVIELELSPTRRNTPILNALQDFIAPLDIPDRLCEKCKATGCTSQMLFGSFPQILMIHRSGHSESLDYSSVLILNEKKYALFAVVCYNGAHWWTYARHLPPGTSWYELNDERVRQMSPTQFPVASSMRILLYFLQEN